MATNLAPIVVRGTAHTPWGVEVILLLQLLLTCAFLLLVIYAGWKGFLWLRKWHPSSGVRS
jgi:hypothetical protein